MITARVSWGCCLAALLCAGLPAHGGEALFGRTLTADTAEANELAFIQSARIREGRAFGNYDAIDLTSAVEYGWTEDWQTAFVLHGLRLDATSAADEGEPNFTRHGWYLGGASAEFAHKLKDSRKDGWGLTVAGEIAAAVHAPTNGLERFRF